MSNPRIKRATKARKSDPQPLRSHPVPKESYPRDIWERPLPVYEPLASPEELAAIDKAEAAAAARRRPRPARQPQQCVVAYAFSATEKRDLPRLRLEGKWLEALGFAPRGKADIRVQDGGLLITPVIPPPPPAKPARRRPASSAAQAMA